MNILLEELGVKYDAHIISIGGEQFNSVFVALNPSKYFIFIVF